MMRIVFISLFALLSLSMTWSTDWPVSRGTPNATGVIDSEIDKNIELAWEFKTKKAIEGTPAIVGDVVYVASTDKHVYAIDINSGKEIWKSLINSPIKASVGVKDDRLYVGDVDGQFHCLNAKDGKKLWSFESNQEIVSGCNFYEDKVLFTSNDGNLYCLDKNKKLHWKFGIDQPIYGSPSINGHYTYVAGCDEIFHVVDLRTGQEVSQINLGGQSGATVAVDQNVAYLGTMANQVVAIDLQKPDKPQELWRFEAKNRQQPFYSSAALTPDLVLIGSRDKRLHALDRKTGEEKWSVPTDGVIDGSPLVIGKHVYFGNLDSDGWLYIVDIKSGTVVEKITLDSTATGSPAANKKYLFVSTEKGTLYCYKKKPLF
jgi:outer membrane protein assembly factor BamB